MIKMRKSLDEDGRNRACHGIILLYAQALKRKWKTKKNMIKPVLSVRTSASGLIPGKA
jgi:hypothetical protein